jgi:hypothetical protein
VRGHAGGRTDGSLRALHLPLDLFLRELGERLRMSQRVVAHPVTFVDYPPHQRRKGARMHAHHRKRRLHAFTRHQVEDPRRPLRVRSVVDRQGDRIGRRLRQQLVRQEAGSVPNRDRGLREGRSRVRGAALTSAAYEPAGQTGDPEGQDRPARQLSAHDKRVPLLRLGSAVRQ